MESTGHASSDSPSENNNNNNPPAQSALLKAKRSSLTLPAVDESFEQFLQALFAQHGLNEAAQLNIRELLSRNLINSLYSLSRSSPSTLILAGLPALFVDECSRAALFVADPNIKPSPDPVLKSGTSLKWGAGVDMEPSQNLQLGRFSANSHRGLNWSLHEILVLLDSIKRDDVAAAKVGFPKKYQSAEERWENVSQYCSQRDVHKSAQQCLRKWEKLSSYFKKIYDYEKRHSTGFDSFWHLSRHERKHRSLPISFNRDVYDAMVNKLHFDQATNSGNFSTEFPYMGGDQVNGEAEQLPEDAEEESVSFSSEHQQNNGRSRKHELRLPSPSKDRTENETRELFDRFKRMENKRQQVDRERLACDEKRNTSLCTSIAEIATAIRSIAHAIQSKNSVDL